MKIGVLCQHRSGHSAYEQQLAEDTGLEIAPEFDLNHKNVYDYIRNLPKNCIFSMMPREGIGEVMFAHTDIEWRILLREDFTTQCLSFVYTNKTQVFNGEQQTKEQVDIGLVDTFFDYYKIIKLVAEQNLYKIYKYEDLDFPLAYWKKNNNQYTDLISNINEVMQRIGHYRNQLSL